MAFAINESRMESRKAREKRWENHQNKRKNLFTNDYARPTTFSVTQKPASTRCNYFNTPTGCRRDACPYMHELVPKVAIAKVEIAGRDEECDFYYSEPSPVTSDDDCVICS